MSAVRYVESHQVTATRPSGSVHLRISLESEFCVREARIKRVFPLSKPTEFLSIQGSDGKEIMILKSMAGLDAETTRLITEELDRRYFTPQISQITYLKQEAGMWHFEVETQRGPASFYVRNWRDSAFELKPGRWQILSVDGARFEIEDLEKLDVKSQRFLELLL